MTSPLWTSRSAAVLRAALLPPALAFRAATELRRRAYALGLMRRFRPPVPTVCVGNLSVGGTGKTPVTQWISRYCQRQGLRPGVLLRASGRAAGGGDEAALHRAALPAAVIVADPNRPRAARRAIAAGATALILDDGFQRFDLERDLDLVLVSADAVDAADWPLPAGPWREPWSALRRADIVIVTRKAASDGDVGRMVARVERVRPERAIAVARMAIGAFVGLHTRRLVKPEDLAGRRLLAVAGIGDPRAFGRQLEALGAVVRLARRPDHYRYPERDMRRLRDAAAEVDYVVFTAKDAVKLETRWPATGPEPLVAALRVTFDRGRAAVEDALAHAFTPLERCGGGSAEAGTAA